MSKDADNLARVQSEVTIALSEMLLRRAQAGNCQSKNGLEAACGYEVFRFVDALDKLTKDHQP